MSGTLPGRVSAQTPGPADIHGALVSDVAALPSTDTAILLLAGIGLTQGVHGFEDAGGTSGSRLPWLWAPGQWGA